MIRFGVEGYTQGSLKLQQGRYFVDSRLLVPDCERKLLMKGCNG